MFFLPKVKPISLIQYSHRGCLNLEQAHTTVSFLSPFQNPPTKQPGPREDSGTQQNGGERKNHPAHFYISTKKALGGEGQRHPLTKLIQHYCQF